MSYREEELMQRFRNGDEQAFTELYNNFYERLYWYGMKFIKEEPEVEDIISEAYIQMWKKRQNFTDFESVAAFLHVTIRNQCYNFFKHRQIKIGHQPELIHLLEEQQTGDFFIEQLQVELMRKIYEQVELLPIKMKEIFLLSYEEGLKPQQIAERLNLNVQTVKNRKVTVLKVLKAALSQQPLLLVMLALLENTEKNIH